MAEVRSLQEESKEQRQAVSGFEFSASTPLRLWCDRLSTPIGELIVLTDHEKRIRLIEWNDPVATKTASPRCNTKSRSSADSVADREPFMKETPPEDSASPIDALRAYFAGNLKALDRLPVETAGTPFQRAVWDALREIPCGQTISYAELARRIGGPAAIRAVGLANGANPVSIVVPCHRVIGANGSLTGYGGGLERKRWLLTHEGASATRSLFSGA